MCYEKNIIKGFFVAIAFSVLCVGFYRCTPPPQRTHPEYQNITVFIDLSSRIWEDKTLSPSQIERDLNIVNNLLDIFVDNIVKSKNIAGSKDCFKIICYPEPQGNNTTDLLKGLYIDMSELKPADKKRLLVDIKNKKELVSDLQTIYNDIAKDEKRIGSDIWGFFNNKSQKIDEYCIKEGYKNTLVILTDGYIDFRHNRDQKDDGSYTFIKPDMLDIPNFRLSTNRNNISNLDVLMLEINPGQNRERQKDKLIDINETWLKEMGIKHYKVAETEANSKLTNMIINNFFNNNSN